MWDVRRLVGSGLVVSLLACAGPSDDDPSGDAATGGRSRHGYPGDPQPRAASEARGEVIVRAGTASLPAAGVERFIVDVDRIVLEYGDAEDPPTVIDADVAIDLLDLVNGRSTVLGTARPGRPVTRVSLDVSCAHVHLSDGVVLERPFPRHGAAHFEVTPRRPIDSRNVFVQFDADRSLLRLDEGQDVVDPERVLVHLAVRVFDGTSLSTIGGHVVDDAGTPEDPRDDRPIAFAPIVLEQGESLVARSRTDADGAYAFVGPYAGDFDVVCSPEARVPDARAIHVVPASVQADEDLRFEMADAEGW